MVDLPEPVGAQQGDDLARLHLEVDLVQHGRAP
jgi:hypothetical protein